MFCHKCGTQNPEDGKFCRACGTDLGTISDTILRKSSNQMQHFGMMQPIQPIQLWDKKGKIVSWEGALGTLFMGIAFLIVSLVVAFSRTGNDWWFWMLIPALSMIGGGVAKVIRLKKGENRNVSFSPADETQNAFEPAAKNANLPPAQTDYIRTQKSIYDTGELVAPPSVVEGTTRHLEFNREGETMTLPKKEG
jgi:hypothetical protein